MRPARLFAALLLGTLLFAQQPALDPANPVDKQVLAYYQAKDWPGLADHFETMGARDRGRFLYLWFQSLHHAQRWERLLAVCEAVIPQLEAKSGPRISEARALRALALSRLGRHAEAMAAHGENGRLGLATGFESACSEAQALQDWGSLVTYAEALAKTRPGLGLSLKGEALAKQLKFAEAEPVLLEAVQQKGHTAMAWADLACCQVERQAYPEAVEAADRALALEPKHMEALYNRGRARFGLKQYREGREDLASALATGQADASMAQNLRQNIAMADRYLAYREKAPRKASAKTKAVR